MFLHTVAAPVVRGAVKTELSEMTRWSIIVDRTGHNGEGALRGWRHILSKYRLKYPLRESYRCCKLRERVKQSNLMVHVLVTIFF